MLDHIDNVRYHNESTNLQWLTPKENQEKVIQCGRQRYASGVKHGMCNLKDWQLEAVGRLLGENILTQKEISFVTGVPHNTVLEIRAGRRFKYLMEKYHFENYNRLSRTKHTLELVNKVCVLLESGHYSMREISKITGMGYSSISDIAHGRTYQNIAANYNLSIYVKTGRKKYVKKKSE